jgi:hypothetical protein
VAVTCPSCGRENEGRESFCDSCGYFLGWAEGQPADTQQLEPQVPPRREDQRAGVQVRLGKDLIAVVPGGAESTAFVIKNLGTKVEEFGLSLTGPDWLAVDPAVLSVYPGQEGTGVVQAAPPRVPGSTAGVTAFRLTVTSALHSHVSSSAAARVDVGPYYEFAAELAPSSSRGRGWTRHTVTLKNGSNLPLRIALKPTDVADGLRLSVASAAEVAPGEVIEVPVAVHGPFRWFGRPEPRTFSITAEPPKPVPPARLSGTRVVVPLFPKWVPAAVAGALAAAIAAAVIAAKVLHKQSGHLASSTSSSSSSPSSSAAAGTKSSAASSSSGTKSSPASSAPASSSSSPPSSPATSSSPAPVANVAGDALAQADTTLRAEGLKPKPQAFYQANATTGDVVRTLPAAGTTARRGSSVEVLVPTPPFDMFSKASSAHWEADSQHSSPSARVTFGQRNLSTGAAFSAEGTVLEDGTTPKNELETHPPSVTGSAIWGIYTLPTPFIAQQQFRAGIGFSKGTGGKIQYQVIAIKANGSRSILRSQEHTAGSRLDSVSVLLPAGIKQIELRVTSLDSSPMNNAIWVAPRIEPANTPP